MHPKLLKAEGAVVFRQPLFPCSDRWPAPADIEIFSILWYPARVAKDNITLVNYTFFNYLKIEQAWFICLDLYRLRQKGSSAWDTSAFRSKPEGFSFA